jgi:hypothetical protein
MVVGGGGMSGESLDTLPAIGGRVTSILPQKTRDVFTGGVFWPVLM